MLEEKEGNLIKTGRRFTAARDLSLFFELREFETIFVCVLGFSVIRRVGKNA